MREVAAKLTPRDVSVLAALARYYVLTREQVQRLCFPDDPNGRVIRRLLQAMVAERYANRHTLYPVLPTCGSPAPVYYPAKHGCEFLAAHTGDEHFALACTTPPQPNNLLHWIAITDAHITLDTAAGRLDAVTLSDWLNEWDVANKDESEPDKRFTLYTLLERSPKLVCAPDAGFVLGVTTGGTTRRKAFYLEFDRGTVSGTRIAASRPRGYAELAARRGHRRHFPGVTVDPFAVVLLAPSRARRDNLRKELAGKPGAELWKIAALPEFTPETALTGSIYYPCGDGEPPPLVRPESLAAAPAEVPS